MSDYQKLEYIESTGTQYIDIGFKLSSNHAVDMNLQLTTINSNIFGSRAGAMNSAFTLFANGSSILTDMGDTRNSTTATTDRINVYLSSSKIKIGTFEKNISSGSFTTPGNGYIFNISYSRPQSYMASMKLYGCKIYLSGTLIRDLIPCKYNNQIGLWDTINGLFLGNAGTGEFIAGPEQGNVTIKYTELKYIESTGTQYINTGIYPTSTNFKAEIQYQFTRTTGPGSNREAWVFGIWNGSSGWRCGCSGTSLNNVGSGFTFDNTLSTNKTIATSNACTATSSLYQVVLFGQGESGGPGHISDSLFRIYYCKIWNGNALVRDFIPCEYEGVFGLWDKVSNQFFTNSGSGTFVAGPIIAEEKIKLLNINGYLQPRINGKKVYLFNDIQTHYNVLDPFNYEFDQLEYIKATGTQYIDTGMKFKTDFACDIKFNMLSTNGDIDILSSAQNDNYLLVSYLNGTPRIYLNGSGSSKNITMPYNAIHTVNMNYNGTTLTYKVDDTTTYTVSKSNATANSNLLLFARSSSYGFSNAILYYCKIYEGENLVRDFIPVKQKKTNKIGLYDKVSKTFFGNSGAGAFLYQEKKEINYIELTGTQYINTMIAYLSGATQYGFYLDFEPTEVDFTGNSIYSVSSGNSATESSINADGLLYYKYGGNQRNVSTLIKNIRYVYEVDHRDRTLKITLNGESKSYDQILANFGEPLYLGYRNGGGYGKFKIYNFKIYKSDVLVQDLIPVKVIEGDNTTFCFYDKVTGTYFNNSGTGEFIGG